MSKNAQTAAEHVSQLQALVTAMATPTDFKVGQLARRRAITLPKNMRDNHHIGIGAVVEVVPSMRERTGDIRDTSGPGLVLAHLDPEGNYAEALLEAWQYEVVTPEEIAALLGQTSH